MDMTVRRKLVLITGVIFFLAVFFISGAIAKQQTLTSEEKQERDSQKNKLDEVKQQDTKAESKNSFSNKNKGFSRSSDGEVGKEMAIDKSGASVEKHLEELNKKVNDPGDEAKSSFTRSIK